MTDLHSVDMPGTEAEELKSAELLLKLQERRFINQLNSSDRQILPMNRDEQAARSVPAILDQAVYVEEIGKRDSSRDFPTIKASKASELLKKVPSIPRDASREVRLHAPNFMATRSILWDALWNGVNVNMNLDTARAILCPGELSDRELEAMKGVMRKHIERLAAYPASVLEKILSVADHSCDMYVFRFILHAVVTRSEPNELMALRDVYRGRHNFF